MFDPSVFDIKAAQHDLRTAQDIVERLEGELKAAKIAETVAMTKVTKANEFDKILREIRTKLDSLKATHLNSEGARFLKTLGDDSRQWAASDHSAFVPQEFGRWLEGKLLLSTDFIAEKLKAIQGAGGKPFSLPSNVNDRRDTLTKFAEFLLSYVELDSGWPELKVIGSDSSLMAEVEIRFEVRDMR